MLLDIIGAGIGGLTTAIALQNKGIPTRIFEQARGLKPIGAGIIMANNAMQVYDQLGLRKEIEQSGNAISSLNVTDRQLRCLSRVKLHAFEKKYGVQNVAIHRGKLQQVLAGKLEAESLKLDHKLDRVVRADEGFRLFFKNGEEYFSQALIGADGLNSTVRNELFKTGRVRNTNQLCWRGVAEYVLPPKFRHELNEAWGLGDRFGFVQIDDRNVYWYAVKSFHHQSEPSIEEIRGYYGSYHLIVRELLQQTPADGIHTALLTDLHPMPEWWQPNVCLLGDAAHAATPNMGQGACQAIEDAYILSGCLDTFGFPGAFAAYQKIRLPKARQVVKTSWAIGQIAHWKHPLAVRLRNLMMRWVPDYMNRKQSEKIFQLGRV